MILLTLKSTVANLKSQREHPVVFIGNWEHGYLGWGRGAPQLPGAQPKPHPFPSREAPQARSYSEASSRSQPPTSEAE